MSPRDYFIGSYDDEWPMTADEIYIEDDDPHPTGILSLDGRMIYRQREKIPFGFVVS